MTQKFDLTSLELFVAVCDAKSITKAAELENIVASAVSKRIAQLEHLAGTPLLIRSRSGVTPTVSGVTLLEHARNVLHNLDLIDRDLSASPRNLRGFVRVFATMSAIAEFIPTSLVSFLASPKHRDIDIQVEEVVSHEVVLGVKDGLAAIGICSAEAGTAGLEWIPYRSDHLSVIALPNHPLASRKEIRFEETLQYDHAGLRPTSAVTAMLRREAARSGTVMRYRVLVSTFEAVLGVVKSGLAIGIIPAEIASQYTMGSGIRVIPLMDTWARRQFSICCRSRRSLPRAAGLFVSHLLSEFNPT